MDDVIVCNVIIPGCEVNCPGTPGGIDWPGLSLLRLESRESHRRLGRSDKTERINECGATAKWDSVYDRLKWSLSINHVDPFGGFIASLFVGEGVIFYMRLAC